MKMERQFHIQKKSMGGRENEKVKSEQEEETNTEILTEKKRARKRDW